MTSTPLARTVDYLLIGGGLARATAAKAIRHPDPRGSILLVTDEPELPYHRPPLSKEYLRGETHAEGVYGKGGVYVHMMAPKGQNTVNAMTFSLEPVPPFRLDLTVWTLRRRPDNLIDRWGGQTYRRVLALEDEAVELAATQFGASDAPHLRVTLRGVRLAPEMEEAARAFLTRTLGLSVDLAAFYRFAEADAKLGPLVQRFRGAKPPRFPSLFEALGNGIACQQITLTQGIRLLNRLTQTYGLAFPNGDAAAHAFPRSRDLARLAPQELRPLGFSGQKGRALIELASAIDSGRLDLETLAELDDDAALARLLALRGIGRWTAEYVLLRGLGRLDRFPGDDVGARNNLSRWLGLTDPLDYVGVQRTIAPWSAYGGLLYFHLLLDRLAEAGYLQ